MEMDSSKIYNCSVFSNKIWFKLVWNNCAQYFFACRQQKYRDVPQNGKVWQKDDAQKSYHGARRLKLGYCKSDLTPNDVVERKGT